MLSCAEAFDMDWDALYMSAPIWRFSLSAGLAGPGAMMGVLMPSVDRVGRRFPLTLMQTRPINGSILSAHRQNDALFARMEDLALAALDDMPKDTLDVELSRLAPQADMVPEHPGPGLTLVQGTGLSGARPDPSAGLMGYHFRAASVWSTQVDQDARLMICEGLPRQRWLHALMNLSAPIWAEAQLQ